MQSLSFDRAAGIYDSTRTLPSDIQDAISDAMEEELGRAGTDRLLEIGVGTGRMARPLAARGIRVCGIDISRLMLDRLRAQLAPGDTPPDVMLGDATRLPLGDGVFKAALAVHVLHLVSDWRRVLEEVKRVLGPGGVFIQQTYGGERTPWHESQAKWDEMLKRRGFQRRKRPEPEEIAAALRELGAKASVREVARNESVHLVREIIQRTRDRTHSWTWEIPEELLFAVLPEYEEWLAAKYGGLDGEIREEQVFQIEAWQFS